MDAVKNAVEHLGDQLQQADVDVRRQLQQVNIDISDQLQQGSIDIRDQLQQLNQRLGKLKNNRF